MSVVDPFAVGHHTLLEELRKEERASRSRHWQQVAGRGCS